MGRMSEIHVRVQELGNYCAGSHLSLDGLQERIAREFADIPPSILRGPDVDFVHQACTNERVTSAIIECLLDAFPGAARSMNSFGRSPLHYACENRRVDPGIVRVLLDRWPESANHRNNTGALPLHYLCACSSDDKLALLTILNLLLAAAPNSATAVDHKGHLPIHLASKRGDSYPFCKRLIDAYPASLKVRVGGMLPIHIACYGGRNVETVKYMLEMYPESIDARDTHGNFPIQYAVAGEASGKYHKSDIIRYLLAEDPDCASKTGARQDLPLHLACDANCLDPVRLLFDAYPEAITVEDEDGRTPIDVARQRGGDAVTEFLEAQLAYVHLAEDTQAMHTVDEDGWLPLHRALRKNASLGAIKLLIAGNRDALQVSDNPFAAFPLHVACGFSSVGVVEHLLGLSDNHLHALDLERDSTLHYACRGGNVGVVKCLLGRGVPSVSVPNDGGKLPIHLLWESGRVDRNSVEYVEAIWLLLLAHPETVRL